MCHRVNVLFENCLGISMVNFFLFAFQVESRYFYKIPGDWPRMGQNEDSPEKIHKVLDDNVEQISTVSIEIFIMHAA